MATQGRSRRVTVAHALAGTAALFWLTTAAAVEAGAATAPLIEEIVVVADKAPRSPRELIGTVTVIDARQLEGELAGSFGDLFRFVPGVAQEGHSTRFGADGISVRGVGGNRVLIEADGIPVSEQFDIGAFSHAARELHGIDLIKRVEVLRGPASTLYGSAAIGGVIAVSTFEPEDLILPGRQLGGRLNMRYDSRSNARAISGLAALRQGGWSGFLHLARTQHAEIDNRAAAQRPQDLQQGDAEAATFKLRRRDGFGNVLQLSGGVSADDTRSEIRSLPGSGRQFRNTTRLSGDDHDRRRRLALEYRIERPATLLDGGRIRAWLQGSETEQFTEDERAATDPPVLNERVFRFAQNNGGLALNLHKRLAGGGADHRLSFGIEYRRARTRELRDALQTRLDDGSQTNVLLGEHFPLRDFPVTDSDEIGVYVQDPIQLPGSRWSLVPGLRYERYRVLPDADPRFRAGAPDAELVRIEEQALTPKLGLLLQLSEAWDLFAQYARGFRAPAFDDANIVLNIPFADVRVLPNPGLRAERSDSLELGARWFAGAARLDLALFHNRYDDFIDNKAPLGPDPDSGTLLFQSRNIERATISGAEARFQWPFRLARDQLRLDLGLAWARGRNEATGRALNAVEPPHGRVSLNWAPAAAPLELGLMASASGRAARVDESGGPLFRPAGHALFDLFAAWTPSPRLRLNLALINLGNRRYWNWNRVRGLSPEDPTLPLLSGPGLNAALSAAFHW